MKNLVLKLAKSTLVAVLVLGSNSIYAVGDVKVAPISGSKKARIYVAPEQNENVKLTVLNEYGSEFIYSAVLSEKTSYNKVYDFNNLSEGTYKIVAESNSKIIENDIAVSKEGITVLSENEKYKPFFNLKEGKLIISYLNKGLEDVSVSFSSKTSTFFSDEPISEMDFMKAYDLANLVQGEYYVSVNSGADTYSYYFEVK